MTVFSREIPELAALESRQHLVRIPPELDVPLTPRVQRLVDTSAFRRLAKIPQLGLVNLVYPGANHTRFEHSLGVYHTALLFLQRLQHDPRFTQIVDLRAAQLFLVAALLHDVGHWPFCHPIEDLQLTDMPQHEVLVRERLVESELQDLLATDWGITSSEISDLLAGNATSSSAKLLSSMLSGPIDVDKMDYLVRDSLHAGVPYGRNFDRQRLIGSLCVNESGDALAITEKGRTAAEMMVFARYIMFSEVYWHHAVRAATVMFQRAFHDLAPTLQLDELFRLEPHEFLGVLRETAGASPAGELLRRLFGEQRCLHKRWYQFSRLEHPVRYSRLARQPFPELVQDAQRLARALAELLAEEFPEYHLLIDAPPVGAEVEFLVDVYYRKERQFRPLTQVSPVVKALAEQQFDDVVKRVRIFADAHLLEKLVARQAASELSIAPLLD